MTGRTVGVLLVCGLAAVAGGGIWAIRSGSSLPQPPAEPLEVAGKPVEPVAPRPAPERVRRPERVVSPAEPAGTAAAEPASKPAPVDEAARDAARREAWEKMRAEAVKRFDTDGDGQLNDAERAVARSQWDARGAEVRELMVRRYDADGDGQLNEQEREAARQEMREVRREISDRLVPQYDLDGDGELNEQERAAARPAYEAEYDRLRVVAMLDRDGSRAVEPTELALAIIAISDGDPSYDLNRDGKTDYQDATYATEIAQGN